MQRLISSFCVSRDRAAASGLFCLSCSVIFSSLLYMLWVCVHLIAFCSLVLQQQEDTQKVGAHIHVQTLRNRMTGCAFLAPFADMWQRQQKYSSTLHFRISHSQIASHILFSSLRVPCEPSAVGYFSYILPCVVLKKTKWRRREWNSEQDRCSLVEPGWERKRDCCPDMNSKRRQR